MPILFCRTKFVCAWLLSIVALGGRTAEAQEKGIADFPRLNAERDWPWWRGPQRDGHAAKADVPVKLDEAKNLLWKTKVPGRGHASPIVVGSQVFLSTSNPEKQIHSVIAFDLQSGNQTWSLDLNQGGFPEINHPKNSLLDEIR